MKNIINLIFTFLCLHLFCVLIIYTAIALPNFTFNILQWNNLSKIVLGSLTLISIPFTASFSLTLVFVKDV